GTKALRRGYFRPGSAAARTPAPAEARAPSTLITTARRVPTVRVEVPYPSTRVRTMLGDTTVRSEEVAMTMRRRPVIAGVDGSAASFGAARWAADEAVRLHQPLNVVRVVEPPGPVREDADEHRVAIDIAAACRAWQPGLEVTAAVWGG